MELLSIWHELVLPYGGKLLHGAAVTLALTAGFLLFGSVGALGLIALRYAPTPLGLGARLVQLYVMVHRNVPMVVQLLFWYFGAPELLPNDWVDAIYATNSSEFIFSVVALSCCFAAYLCEDLRSGIEAVPKAQIEAAKTLGLPFFERLRSIVLPQALRTAWPAIASQAVLFFKATSLAAAIGVSDLASVGQYINNNSFRTLETFGLITVVYILMSWLLASAFSWAETRLNQAVPPMIHIASDFWLLLLIGQYPNGPLGGLSMTLIMSLATIALVIPCAIGLSLALVSPHRWLRSSSAWLAQTIRGVPLLMCVFWVYFGIPLLIGRPVAGPVALVIALMVYHTAYVAEILRAGIAAIPASQNDAVKTLGLGYWSQMLSIALPQAFITMAPSLILKISSIVKDTSVAYIISTPELSFAASQINAVLVTQPLQVFGLLAAVYFVICGALTALANHVQQRSSAFKAR